MRNLATGIAQLHDQARAIAPVTISSIHRLPSLISHHTFRIAMCGEQTFPKNLMVGRTQCDQFLARDDLRQPLHHRAGHHRHELERTAFLWAKKRRGAKGFVGSGQSVAGTKEQATSCSGGQVASGWRSTKTSRR